MGVIQREMGLRTLVLYLLGISISSVLLGMLTNQVVEAWNISIAIGHSSNRNEAGEWIAAASGLVLLYFAIMSIKRSWDAKTSSLAPR
jgi:cytochrome c biogenesis protein CcdA